MDQGLGDLQQLVLLATARLGDKAFAGAVRDEIERVGGRSVTVSTVYVTLTRLEERGLVTSARANDSSGRGGRPRRYFTLTPIAWRALDVSRRALESLWAGLEPA